jgi:hypothetical protein
MLLQHGTRGSGSCSCGCSCSSSCGAAVGVMVLAQKAAGVRKVVHDSLSMPPALS